MKLFILLLLGTPLILMIDSPRGDEILFGYGQSIATLLMFIAFVMGYRKSIGWAKDVMLIGVVIGLLGEFFFSSVLGMYTYRLENIPLWLAFGYGLIFASVFMVSRKPWVRERQVPIQQLLIAFAACYSVYWLMWANDWYGFICTLVFMLILFTAKKSRLFFLIMFAVVCYIEQLGTTLGCWYWPEIVLNIESWLPSGNPPSGIAVFYFLFDGTVFWIYLNILHTKTKRRYQNIINIGDHATT